MARPAIFVNFEKLAKICQYPLTNEDIASLMDMSVDTIYKAIKKKYGIDFAEYKRQKQSSLRFTLLARQIEAAKSGNIAMLIWLGKQYLGQRDKTETEIAGTPIQIVIDEKASKL